MLYTALILGLVSSMHCIGMCGPIAMMLPVDRKNPALKTMQILLYHFGRIVTYVLIGGIFGIFGRGFYLAGFQQNLSIILGVLMILYVIIPQNWYQGINVKNPLLGLFTYLRSKLGAQFQKKSLRSFFTIGFLNGFLPCGMLYVALFGALSFENFFQSISYMALYGIGTIPLMTLVVYFSQVITPNVRNKFQKLIPFVIVIFGILMVLRGLGLDISHISPSNLNLFIQGEANCK